MSSFNNSRILIKFCYFSRAAELFTSSRALDHFRLGEGGFENYFECWLIRQMLKACWRSSLRAWKDPGEVSWSYPAWPCSSTCKSVSVNYLLIYYLINKPTKLRKSMYMLASLRVSRFDNLSEGWVGTISRSLPNASFKLWVLCLSLTFAGTQDN